MNQLMWSMIYFQDANSPFMEHFISFHDYIMMIIMMITMMILYIMMTLIINKNNNKYILQNHNLEIIWTIFPVIILICMAIPSLKILYLIEAHYVTNFTIKVIGHQWYWSYEYSDFLNVQFNSFIVEYSIINNFRLLDVDNRMIVPNMTSVRLLITSVDVIHSWAIPSLGLKMDAIPGRINMCYLYMFRPGLYFGQCSEICGMYHSFMPIVVESTSPLLFMYWLKYLT